MSHLDNLGKITGGLRGKKILDIGAGRGEFLLACAERGYDAVGIEINDEKISDARTSAHARGLPLELVKAEAEHLPFADNTFDFANMGEVIEHVRNPVGVLTELYRVLKPGGKAYISAHNRFGMYDTHFHVYFLGWLPRAWAAPYLSILRKHKDYAHAEDLQDIREMHYFTFGGFQEIASRLRFTVIDSREVRMRHNHMLMWLYRYLLRPIYFSTFHLLLMKT